MNGKVVTAPGLSKMKARGERISMVTAYDYAWARLADEAGMDMILVGDTLGMVVLGYDSTLQVTMEDMIRHTKAVTKGAKRALVVADMPFMSYQVSVEDAVRNAGRLISEAGAHAVKLEGGDPTTLSTIHRLAEIGIPVVGHVGLTPQSVYAFGGFKTQGKDSESAERILNEALELQSAGACAIVLEKIPFELAAEITRNLTIPTIGIGAGPHCDGQVLVMHDMLGLYDKFVPSFVKQYANLWQTVLEAFQTYSEEVKEGKFPGSGE